MIRWNRRTRQTRSVESSRWDERRLIHVMCLSVVSLLGVVLFSYGPVRAAESSTPTHTVQAAVNRVMEILADPDWQTSDRSRERKRLVVETISDVMDYDEMAMRVLGQGWRGLSDRDRKAFVDAFRQFMESSYEGRFKDYSGEQVRYLGEQLAGDFAEVRTRLVSRKVDLPVSFRLVHRGETWRVYDILVDGISLVGNYRAQFASVLRETSFQALLVKLMSKTVDVPGQFAESVQPIARR